MKTIRFICFGWSAFCLALLSGQEKKMASFQPYFSYLAEGWSIVDGGSKTGERYLGLTIVGFDWSPEAMGNGKLHLEAQSMHGRSPTNYAGDFNTISNSDFNSGTRLFQAWYGRGADWGDWKIGQLALDDDFMTSDYADLFINAGFGPMPTQSANVAAPIWPIGGLGAHARVDISHTSSLQFGLYDGDAGNFASNDDGLNNSLDPRVGYMLVIEYARSTDALGGQTGWKLGGYHHTGKEFLHQQNGAKKRGLSSLYTVIDHKFSKTFGLWVRFGASQNEEISTVSSHVDGGMVFSGPFPSRPDDHIGIGLLRTKFSDDYLNGTPNVSDHESVMELTYHAPLYENFHIQPDIQWIFNSHESKDDVFVLGLRFGIEY